MKENDVAEQREESEGTEERKEGRKEKSERAKHTKCPISNIQYPTTNNQPAFVPHLCNQMQWWHDPVLFFPPLHTTACPLKAPGLWLTSLSLSLSH